MNARHFEHFAVRAAGSQSHKKLADGMHESGLARLTMLRQVFVRRVRGGVWVWSERVVARLACFAKMSAPEEGQVSVTLIVTMAGASPHHCGACT